jgi:protein O-GlcNAc transferase
MTIQSPDAPQEQTNSIITLFSNGKIHKALGVVETLTKSYPNDPLLYNISGACYADLGQLDVAVKHYEKALAIKPDYAEAHNNLGNAFKELGQLDTAVKSYEKALTIKPDLADTHYNLGVTLQGLGQLNAAVKNYQLALAVKPDYTEAFNNLCSTLKELGQLDIAVKSYEQILAINPDLVEAHNNLGIALKELDQLDAAIKSYEKALSINPEYAEAHNNLGNVLNDLGQLDAAIKSYEKAIAIQPDYAEVHNNLGNTLKDLGQIDSAIKCFEKTLAIKPDYAEAHNNLGLALMELDQLDDAIRCYDKALNIRPDFAEVHFNCGILMVRLKRMDEALINFERALVLNPDLDFLLGHSLHIKMHLCIWDDLPNDLNELTKKINNNKKVIEPFSMLALIDDPEIQRKTAEIFANTKYPKNHDLPEIGRYPKHKKIRIGYFSADFGEHPVSALTAELYEVHDRGQFEIHAFSYGPDTKDKMNLRIKAGVDHFHEVHKMLHKDIAKLARSLEIDIAVNLGGHTQDARTGIFAMSAAPIQVNYLGYAGTMGADYMDYLIADQTLIPKDKQDYYSENIAYLPYSFMVNDTKNKASKKIFTRAEVGLPINGFVFCCFNNHFKITPSTFIRWMRILSKVDGSVLWLPKGSSTANNNLKKEAKKHSVDENRIIFASRLTLREDHLKRIQLADLFLDTIPYNAHATTSDALRMGLPVLTCIGNSFASRVAASLINSVNLPELITNTQEQYESLAIQIAKNPEKLKTIKKKLDNNLIKSPLYDTSLFTRHLESAYSMMYDRYQRGLEPDYIYVKH